MVKKRKTKIVYDERTYEIVQGAVERNKSLPLGKIIEAKKKRTEIKKIRDRVGLSPLEKVVYEDEDGETKTEPSQTKVGKKQEEGVYIRTPHGTNWENIKIHFKDTANVNVSVNNNKPIPISCSGMRFNHETQNKPKLAWGVFLYFALEKDHTINSKTIVNSKNLGIDIPPKTVKDRIKEINTTLKKVFTGLDENPIYYDKKIDLYGYKPKFQISHNPDIIKYLESLKLKIEEDNNQD